MKKFLPFPVVPRIDYFTPQKLDNIIDHSGDLKYIFDITPAALARFAYDNEINKSKNIAI